MAILNNSNAISSGGYDVNNSLRFRSSASGYLSRTPASAGNRRAWTWSGWIKRGTLGATMYLFGASSTTGDVVRFLSTNDLQFYFNNGSNGDIRTSQLFRDPSAWYHLVFVCDTANATASNRMRIYVNGSQITAFQSATYPAQNYDTTFNTAVVHNIAGFSPYLDCYLADVNFIDGQALTPSSFGETDTTTGSWKPKAYTGTYGTNGFYLKFSDIATTSGSNAGLGKDFSGNANYWTTNNISVTAGTTYDAMIDSPTLTSATVANYCVGNPINNSASGNITFSQANLALSLGVSGQWRTATATMSMPSGKWYWEVTKTNSTTSDDAMIGIIADTVNISGAYYPSQGALGYTYLDGGRKGNAAGGSAYGASWTNGDVIGVAFDAGTGQLTFYKNGTSQGLAFTVTSGYSYYPAFGGASSVPSYAINFGQRSFSYTPPTGFVRLNTYNLPDSTIKKGNTVMDATLYTGNSSTQSVVNASAFKPDLVWIKGRASAYDHMVYDAVRGVNINLRTNTTGAETTGSPSEFTAFNSNGFTVVSNGSQAYVNLSGQTYVAWQWQAGQGSTTTGTGTGGITSVTQSVNATAGFSIVTYTGSGSNGTVTHGLGVAPKWVIVKARSAAAENWQVYSSSLTSAAYRIRLNATDAQDSQPTMWNSTAPTSTVFSVGTASGVNTSAVTYVAYCWAEIAGFSKFGSYTGNGSADGPFVYTGFRPKYILVKRTDSSTNGFWNVYDSSRNGYNDDNDVLYPNSSAAEDSVQHIDLLSNGFKCRNATYPNTSTGTYIYAAFAENPFKNANAR